MAMHEQSNMFCIQHSVKSVTYSLNRPRNNCNVICTSNIVKTAGIFQKSASFQNPLRECRSCFFEYTRQPEVSISFFKWQYNYSKIPTRFLIGKVGGFSTYQICLIRVGDFPTLWQYGLQQSFQGGKRVQNQKDFCIRIYIS